MSDSIALNLRRLMASRGLTFEQVVESTSLDPKTVRAILGGKQKPHARTLHQLAQGLDVSPDELFQSTAQLAYRSFDRGTNPIVDDVVAGQPELFEGWSAADFDELYSRFGTGGALTASGAEDVARSMNFKRDIHRKVSLLLESDEASLLASLVELLHQRVVVSL